MSKCKRLTKLFSCSGVKGRDVAMLCYAVKLGKYCIQVEQATDRIPIELITGDVFVKFRQGVQSFEF